MACGALFVLRVTILLFCLASFSMKLYLFVTVSLESKKKLYLCITENGMDRATFEKQKPFAGKKKPSMLRRCVDNDYTARRIYMVTMVTEGRKPLFGEVVGRSEAVEPSSEAPHIKLSPLGRVLEEIWKTIGSHHQEVKVVALQMMPDHLHAILFVKEKMEKPLGKVLLGVKQACNQAFRQIMPVEFVAVAQQHAKQRLYSDNKVPLPRVFYSLAIIKNTDSPCIVLRDEAL